MTLKKEKTKPTSCLLIMSDIWNTNKVFHKENLPKPNGHLYRFDSGLDSGARRAAPLRSAQRDTTAPSTSQPPQRCREQSAFVKTKVLWLRAGGPSSYILLSLTYSMVRAPFRLKYCSVVYNVCLIRHMFTPPPSPASHSGVLGGRLCL